MRLISKATTFIVLIILFININGYSQNVIEKKLTFDVLAGSSILMDYLEKASTNGLSIDISASYKISKYISQMVSYEFSNLHRSNIDVGDIFPVLEIHSFLIGAQIQMDSKLPYLEIGLGIFIDKQLIENYQFLPNETNYNPGIKIGFGFKTPLSDDAGIILKPSYNNYWRDGHSFAYVNFVGGFYMKF